MKVTLNPDEEIVKTVKEGLQRTGGYCPCRMLSPVISEIAEEYAGKVKVGKINVDEQPELSDAFGVQSIPMVVLIKDGKTVNTSVGYRPKADILAMLK